MDDIKQLAQSADFIVNGYAFTCTEKTVFVVNLSDISRTVVLDMNGQILKNSMHDIEAGIVQAYWERNKSFSGNRRCSDG